MSMTERIANWLENRWVTPAYSGWLLFVLALCFFGAAVNTMAGWLYAISGLSLALLGMAAILPARSLQGLRVRRYPIEPVSAGDDLTIELELENHTNQPKTLLQIQDLLPFVLSKPVQTPIENIEAGASYRWVYYQLAKRRGIYRWQKVELRTAAPLGLFWCRRSRDVPATAIVYPQVLPLNSCPLIDEMGEKDSVQFYSQEQRFKAATEGLTRSLRPYRIGDPIRLIHWKTSARYGELRVRELEVITGGKEIIICLDTAAIWQLDDFEQAVIAAASLYFYAARQQLNVKLWTAATGLVHGDRLVLETLAATAAGAETSSSLPNSPLLWLTQHSASLNSLPSGSRYLLWHHPLSSQPEISLNRDYPGFVIQTEQTLQLQLQLPLR